ncbi:hypothetical protein L914_02611 [Phytophthora nicotianae]|uniref:Uncharacterized protein n=1 Tax=Phytophthora nicotianae TaxID=4792 RepID=W2NZR6_PHYNI|nr:hypothetical protein L914_02611 [Phytophthora nicotianae]
MVQPIGKVLRDSEVTARDLSFKSAPGDAQLVAAAEVVRQTYTADILAAEARIQATAATRCPAPTTQSPAPATQVPASSAARTASGAVPSTLSPRTPPIRHAKARWSLVQSASPMALMPPRSIRSVVQPLLATSPHLQDSDSASACEDTQITDNESVESAYSPSEPEQGMVNDILHTGQLFKLHNMLLW